jgi:uncharacterized protein (TIGR03086 family)
VPALDTPADGMVTPMSEVSERYATVADGFAARLSGMTDDRWSASSPCDGWTARDVVAHVINTHRRVRASLGDVSGADVESDANLEPQWSSATDAIRSALADESLASRTVGGMFGEQPFEALVGGLLCADTLIHTWDLARASGQDDRLDEGAAAYALEFLEPIGEAIRRPGGFGPKLDPPPGADAQTGLLAFAGRMS